MFCEILVKFIDKFHQIEKNYKMLVAANVENKIIRKPVAYSTGRRMIFLFFRNTANCNYSAQCAQSSQFGN